MKRLLFIFSFLTCAFSVLAQPVLDSNNIPGPGDTLFYLTDHLPDQIRITAPGPKQFWNFSQLDAPILEYTLIEPATAGQKADAFPAAEMVMLGRDGSEAYYRTDASGLHLLGRSESFQEIDAMSMSSFDQGLLDLVSGMEYDDDLDVESMYECQIERSALPPSVRNSLGSEVQRVRLHAKLTRRVTADAWGNMLIPRGQYDVLRVRIDDVCDVSIEMQSENSPVWKAGDAALAEKIIGRKNKSYYRFYADKIKGAIATMYLDENDELERVTFRANPQQLKDYRNIDSNQKIYAFPNPSYGSLRLRFDNLKAGNYSVRFYNILGKQLFEESYEISSAKTVRVDVSRLQKGTYLYALLDERGNKLVTKRIVVLKR